MRQRGMTLAELLVTLAIAGTVAGFAAPAFRDAMAASRQRAAVSDLRVAVLQARSEAIRAGVNAVVEPHGATGDWSRGWHVYLDHDGDGRYSPATDTPLSSTAAPQGINQAPATSAKTFKVGPTGLMVGVTNSCVAFLQAGNLDKPARAVIVSTTGRARIASVAPLANSCSQ